MFLPSNGFDEDDIKNMSVAELMAKLADTIKDMQSDESLTAIVALTDAEKKNYLQSVEKMLLNNKHVAKLERGTLEGFRAGILYGLAFSLKLFEKTPKMRRMLDENPKKNLPKAVKVFTLPFTALDEGIVNWQDDQWFNNLMKNAKVADVKKPKPKKKK